MLPTFTRFASPSRVLLAHAHKPLIHFPDRRAEPSPHSPHPHPAAPSDIRDAFSSFQEKLASGPHFDKAALQPVEALAKGGQVGGTGGAAAASNAVEDVFDLPERFWNTPSLRWEEKEMDAVMSGGAF